MGGCPPPAGIVHVDLRLALLVGVPGEYQIGQLALRRAPGLGLDLEDVPFLAVVGGDPVDVGASPLPLVLAGEAVVGDVEEVGLAAGEVEPLGRVNGVVALDAVLVEDRLDDAVKGDTVYMTNRFQNFFKL